MTSILTTIEDLYYGSTLDQLILYFGIFAVFSLGATVCTYVADKHYSWIEKLFKWEGDE